MPERSGGDSRTKRLERSASLVFACLGGGNQLVFYATRGMTLLPFMVESRAVVFLNFLAFNQGRKKGRRKNQDLKEVTH